jgi:hypothetical protein
MDNSTTATTTNTKKRNSNSRSRAKINFNGGMKMQTDLKIIAENLSYDALVSGLTDLLNRKSTRKNQNIKTEFVFFLEGFNKLNIGITTKFLKNYVVGNSRHKVNRINYILHKAGYSDLKNMPYGNHYHSHLKNGKIKRYKEMLKVVKPLAEGA